MKPMHALLVATAVAVAAVLGLLAATRTTQLGAASSQPKVAATQIARRNHALDRIQAALAAQARRKPPALPPSPTRASASGIAVSAVAAPPAATPQVVYVRPKPIVRIVHRHGGHESEREQGGAELDD